VTDEELAVFVRDRGAGFDPATVAPDRRGIRESIQGRLSRAGGTATVTSSPGGGTEVELRVPR
jgi:signal transduction histidine kinase